MKKNGFTTVELVVVVGIVVSLALLLLPVLMSAKNRSDMVRCMNNMRSLTLAALIYAADHHGQIPDIAPDPNNPDMSLGASNYIDDQDIYVCPRDNRTETEFGPFKTSYTATLFTPANTTNGSISQSIIYIESDQAGVLTRDKITDLSYAATRHGGSTTLAFGDGRATVYNKDSLSAFAPLTVPRGVEADPKKGGRKYKPAKPGESGGHGEEKEHQGESGGRPGTAALTGGRTGAPAITGGKAEERGIGASPGQVAPPTQTVTPLAEKPPNPQPITGQPTAATPPVSAGSPPAASVTAGELEESEYESERPLGRILIPGGE